MKIAGAAMLSLENTHAPSLPPFAFGAGPAVRQRGDGDCLIAAIATALSKTYEEAAALLGMSLNDAQAIDACGIALPEAVIPLMSCGWLPVLISIAGHPLMVHPTGARRINLPIFDDVLPLLQGRRAIIVKEVGTANLANASHAMASDGERVYDPGNGAAYSLDRIPFVPSEVLILFPQVSK